ncbi:MAG: hypothetical protein AAFN79_19085 [Pseudomonadota bacterium]
MSRFKVGELQVETGASVILEGSKSPHFHTVLSGAAVREIRSPTGGGNSSISSFPAISSAFRPACSAR